MRILRISIEVFGSVNLDADINVLVFMASPVLDLCSDDMSLELGAPVRECVGYGVGLKFRTDLLYVFLFW